MNTNLGEAKITMQERILLDYLTRYKTITRIGAMEKLHIANAPEIIRRLKARGHNITSIWARSISGSRYKIYKLERSGKDE